MKTGDYNAHMGQIIRERRKKLKVDQNHMSKVLSISRSSYGNMERGTRPITVQEMFIVFDELEIMPLAAIELVRARVSKKTKQK